MTHPAAAAQHPYPAILEAYYDAIGLPTVLPDWALGFWASKQRYASTAEIIDTVKNYTAHNITVDVLVIDWKHYRCVGDWDFTLNREVCWQDPRAMVSALKELGVQQVFVSLHPWSEPSSVTYSNMTAAKLCARTADGGMQSWKGWTLPTCTAPNTPPPGGGNCLYDVSNPAARAFLWNRLKASYFDQGITNFWTDGTEPAGAPKDGLPGDMVFFDAATGNPELPSPSAFMYWPVWHSKTIFEGSQAGSWSLARSAWAGSHLHNTIVWSGDIKSDWATLALQVKAGLNMQLTYPYWNSDTAGFNSGDWQTMGELIVRWFQFSIFTGVVRMHGSRTPKEPAQIPLDRQCDPTGASGGPIEPWVYGPAGVDALGGVQAALAIRRGMLPYLKAQVQLLASKGQPFMRPVWYDFPEDPAAQDVEDSFMFGPDFFVAPVTVQGAASRDVVFPGRPGSVVFVDYFTGARHHPGTATVTLGALDTFPLYKVIRSAG